MLVWEEEIEPADELAIAEGGGIEETKEVDWSTGEATELTKEDRELNDVKDGKVGMIFVGFVLFVVCATFRELVWFSILFVAIDEVLEVAEEEDKAATEEVWFK